MKTVLMLITVLTLVVNVVWAVPAGTSEGLPAFSIFVQPEVRLYGDAMSFGGKIGLRSRLGSWLLPLKNVPLFAGVYSSYGVGSYGTGDAQRMNFVSAGNGFHVGYSFSYFQDRLSLYPHLNMGLKWLQLTSTLTRNSVSYVGLSLEPAIQLDYRIIGGLSVGLRASYEVLLHNPHAMGTLFSAGFGLHLQYGFF